MFAGCDAYDWCYKDEQEWCPDVIDTTLTSIASRVKNDVTGFDYNSVNNLTLLSTVLTVYARSSRIAISEAQHVMTAGPLTCSADRVTDLEKIRWLLAQQEGAIDFDADTFDEYFTEQDGAALQKRAGRVCNGDAVMCDNVPWIRRLLRGARNLLSKFKNKMLRSALEEAVEKVVEEPGRGLFEPAPPTPEEAELQPPLNENEYVFKKWWQGPKDGKPGVQSVEEWLDEVPDSFPEVPPDVLEQPGAPDPITSPPDIWRGDIPKNVNDGVPPHDLTPWDRPGTPEPPSDNPIISPHPERPPIDPIEPIPPHQMPNPPERPPSPPPTGEPPPRIPELPEGMELYRAEIYSDALHTFRQLTLTPNTVKTVPGHLMDLGLRWFDVLDSHGRAYKTKLLDPTEFIETPGEWESLPGSEGGSGGGGGGGGGVGGIQVEWIRQPFGFIKGQMEPILNSVGEPLVASAEGVFMDLAPVAGNMASSGVHQGVDLLGSLFQVFRPEGSSASGETVIWNPRSGSVRVHTPSSSSEDAPDHTGDEQSDDDGDENKSEHSETDESKDHDDADKDKSEKSEDTEDKSDEDEDHQTAETTAPETTAPEATAHETTAHETTSPEKTTHRPSTPQTGAPQTDAPDANTATATRGSAAPGTDASHPAKTDSPDNATPSSHLPTFQNSGVPSTEQTSTKIDAHDNATPKSHRPTFHTPAVSSTNPVSAKTDGPDTATPSSHPLTPQGSTIPSATAILVTITSKTTISMAGWSKPVDSTKLVISEPSEPTVSSNPYPYPNQHLTDKWPGPDLPMTFPAPTKAQSTMTNKQTTSQVYPYPDNYHQTPQAHGKTCDHGVYPYPDNYCPQEKTFEYPYPDKHMARTPTTLSTVMKQAKPQISTTTSITS